LRHKTVRRAQGAAGNARHGTSAKVAENHKRFRTARENARYAIAFKTRGARVRGAAPVATVQAGR